MEIIGKLLFVLFVNVSVIGTFAFLLFVFSRMFDRYIESAYSKSAAKWRWRDKSQNYFQKIFLTKQLDKVDKFQYFVFLLFVVCYIILGLLINVTIIAGKLYYSDLFKISGIVVLLSSFFAVSDKRISSHKLRKRKKR